MSKVVKILFEVLKTHLVLKDLGILKTVLNLIERDFFSKRFKHLNDITRGEITFPALRGNYLSLSRW